MSQDELPKIEYVEDTFEEYLGKSDHVSASDCKSFLISPKSYKYFRDNPVTEEKTHYKIGSALHEVVLEPKLFKTNYMVFPKIDKRTTKGKEIHAMYTKKAEGKTIINQDEMDMITMAGQNALENRTLIELMKDSAREVSCYTTDPETGLKIRVRPDILPKTMSTIVDLKTCQDSSKKGFKRDVYKFGYSITDAFYSDFLRRENYVFIAIEKKPPYQVSLFSLDDEYKEYGRNQYRMALDLIKWSQDNDYWCDYTEFEILKECYALGDLDDFFETLERSQLIQIIE
jgi:exodeoxyribonuclease VIII